MGSGSIPPNQTSHFVKTSQDFGLISQAIHNRGSCSFLYVISCLVGKMQKKDIPALQTINCFFAAATTTGEELQREVSFVAAVPDPSTGILVLPSWGAQSEQSDYPQSVMNLSNVTRLRYWLCLIFVKGLALSRLEIMMGFRMFEHIPPLQLTKECCHTQHPTSSHSSRSTETQHTKFEHRLVLSVLNGLSTTLQILLSHRCRQSFC